MHNAMSLLTMLKTKKSGRVLSIQSHVVSGYVGNKCSTFPLQLFGFDVDAINSVQFSNHTQYKSFHGNRLQENELRELYKGLKENNINTFSWILSGYCGDCSFLREISRVISDARSVNPSLRYICDPVLGDDGEFYVPANLVDIYKDHIIPIADVVTPNSFELEKLTNVPVTNEESCLCAMKRLHQFGPSIIVTTSGILSPDEPDTTFYCYASERIVSEACSEEKLRCFRFEVPIIRGNFVGTGDVFTALLLAWLDDKNLDLCSAVCKVLVSMQILLRRTSQEAYSVSQNPNYAQLELRLIDSRLDLLCPPNGSKINFSEIKSF